MGLKWASQLITQIWELIYRQWLHRSKLNNKGEALDDHTKELIRVAKITDKHKRGQDTLPYRYNSYFFTSLLAILDTSITARQIWYHIIKTARDMTQTDNYTIFSTSKSLHTWLGIQSATSLSTPT